MSSHITTGIRRGLAEKCPHCGEGALYRKYLKVQETCEVCGHDNAQYPSDDGPAYFTILIVGHLFVAPIVALPFFLHWGAWWTLAITLPLVTAITLWMLPRVKGGVVGLMWGIREGGGGVPGQGGAETP